jgi:hypothetical protein
MALAGSGRIRQRILHTMLPPTLRAASTSTRK